MAAKQWHLKHWMIQVTFQLKLKSSSELFKSSVLIHFIVGCRNPFCCNIYRNSGKEAGFKCILRCLNFIDH